MSSLFRSVLFAAFPQVLTGSWRIEHIFDLEQLGFGHRHPVTHNGAYRASPFESSITSVNGRADAPFPNRLGLVARCVWRWRSRAHHMHMDLGRTSAGHQVMNGVPWVAGIRIPVATIVGLVANAFSTEEITADYPQLGAEDIGACLGCAARGR